MVTVALFSLLSGMLLGQRFRVLALAPAIAFAVILAAGYDLVHAQALWPAVRAAAVIVACLQIGYIIGVWMRQFVIDRKADGFAPATVALFSPARPRPHKDVG
jgi:hypothetical protein